MEALLLTRELYERMLCHAREAVPMEAVGLLGGHPNGKVAAVLPLINLAGSGKFLADPLAQFNAERWLKSNGLMAVAVYHSHPGGGTELSSTDLSSSLNSAMVQVVIALAHPNKLEDAARVRAYHIRNGMPISVDIRFD